MKRVLSILIALGLLLPSQPWAVYAQSAAVRSDALWQRWGIPAEQFAALPEAQQARLLRGLALLDAGARLQVEKLKRLSPQHWMDYVTPEGRLTPEGREWLARAQAAQPSFFEDLDVKRLGLDEKTVADIAEGVAAGAPAERLTARVNSLFDKGPATAKIIGELGTAAAGAAGASSLSAALASADTALGEATTAKALGAQAQALGAQAKALAAQAAATGNPALAQQAAQLGAQAKQTGAQALAHRDAALAAKAEAEHAADAGKTFTKIAGAIALADGLWDLYKGSTQKQEIKGAIAVENGYREAYAAVAAGQEPRVGARVAAGYGQLFGGQASPAQLEILAAAVDDGVAALSPSAARAAAEATGQATAELEKRLKSARERQWIGGVKSGAGGTLLLTLEPTTAAVAATAYFLASLYQHRDKIKKLLKEAAPPADSPFPVSGAN